MKVIHKVRTTLDNPGALVLGALQPSLGCDAGPQIEILQGTNASIAPRISD